MWSFLKSKPANQCVAPIRSEGELFKQILGDKWTHLHPDIQKRFEKNPRLDKPLFYEGSLEILSSSFFGKILATITKPLIKAALIPYSCIDCPVDITVYSKENCPFIFKQRIYAIPGKKPIKFTSYMKESTNGDVLEYVGSGLCMKLTVFEKEGNLHFKSDGYYLDLGFMLLAIPAIFTPGKTYLTHINEGPNQFRIRIDINHFLFGKLFVQAGVFKQVDNQKQEAA